MIAFDFDELELGMKKKILGGSIIPRPIAVVSTVSKDGVANLAPFSWFTIASIEPAVIAITVRHVNGQLKDTASNIFATKAFVVHIADEAMAQVVQDAAYEFPAEVDEIAKLGLTKVASSQVDVPAIQEAKIRLECTFDQKVSYQSADGAFGTEVIFGRVVAAHLDESVWVDDRVDMSTLKPLARIAGSNFMTTGEVIPVSFSEGIGE